MIHRRRLILQAAALAGASLSPAGAGTLPGQPMRLRNDPFTLGVASGEPSEDGMVLWTRLAPRPLDPDGGMAAEPRAVGWEVFADAACRQRVRHGRATARPEAGHAVHVELAGLKPDRDYWYRFNLAEGASPVGRTRTTPEPSAAAQRLKLAYGSCQKYESGYYHAHAAIAADAPDLVLFLGDYIYEQAATDRGVRRHPGEEARDLAGYRIRYGAYKLDPMLQAAHAAAPWMTIWDDHEVANDYGGDECPEQTDARAFLRRRAAAYQAYYEHMPLRRRSAPVGPDMLMRRTLKWGDLAEIRLLDTRQYRPAPVAGASKFIADSAKRRDPARSLLGAAQETWLLDGLATSQARWNLLAQQYVLGELKLPGDHFSGDGWDGFPACRQRILERWRDARVSNPLALGGDVHAFAAADVSLDEGGPAVAAEFVGGSITSKGFDNSLVGVVRAANPRLRYAEGATRGYGLVEITPEATHVTFRGVDDARAQTSGVTDLAKFVVESGRAAVSAA